MSRIFGGLLLATLVSASPLSSLQADRLLIDALRDGDTDAREMPRHGATKERVESEFGEPRERRAAVGDPPITRWDYEDYSVYFEHDRVLRTVLRRE